jgi:lipopolysaccharide/colanic/teichoic acid biosynthesis glycosyltransferase
MFVYSLFELNNIFSIKPTIPHLKRFSLALITCFIVGIFFFYLIPIFSISPKTNLLFQTLGFGAISFIFRRIFYLIYSKNYKKSSFIIGPKVHMDELYNTIHLNPQIGVDIVSYSEDPSYLIENYKNIKNSIIIIDTNKIELESKILSILYKNQNEILDAVSAYEKYLNKIPTNLIDEYWIINNLKKNDPFYTSISRILDIFMAVTILLVTIPFTLFAMIARLVEDGKPIFIKQKRVGENGKIFNIYKIRSMVALTKDGLAEKDNKPEWAKDKDPRITPLGQILRKTHLDEIPQMINILKGDISLVGPRTERPEFVEELEKKIPYYEFRHAIKPGFTGWAQIKYHYANTVDESKEKFEYDLYYIKNRNIFLDFGIILKTIQIIFTH